MLSIGSYGKWAGCGNLWEGVGLRFHSGGNGSYWPRINWWVSIGSSSPECTVLAFGWRRGGFVVLSSFSGRDDGRLCSSDNVLLWRFAPLSSRRLRGAPSASGLLGDPSRKCPFLPMPEVKAPCFLTSVAREDVVGSRVISRG
ncbi:hypothetical protein Acr_23g0018240 [Actinidia rufa]|uniref:Uncharacterized protein n=1 Tax=Actinidia rufa TaxID=165716 RepID=A0A7J0GRM9_9ERIC|nr:hypothetical protein Acr_23g0018240 [Actinidia rufa]